MDLSSQPSGHNNTQYAFLSGLLGMSERERQVMKKLKEVVDKQRDEIRAKDRELTLKNEDIEAVSYCFFFHFTFNNTALRVSHMLRYAFRHSFPVTAIYYNEKKCEKVYLVPYNVDSGNPAFPVCLPVAATTEPADED